MEIDNIEIDGIKYRLHIYYPSKTIEVYELSGDSYVYIGKLLFYNEKNYSQVIESVKDWIKNGK